MSNESHSFTLPTNLNSDKYYVIFHADDNNRVTESNESNNLRTHSISVSCNSCITSFPYNEGFESGLGEWTQDTGDDIDWTRDANGTSSYNTGPSNASEGTYYMYTEASGANYPSKIAHLISPCFNLSSINNPLLTFKYHMYGSYMGTLQVQVSTDGGSSWSNLWTKAGNQGNSWQSASISLNTYTSQTSLMIRFKGTTGTSYTSDMAIDDISIGGSPTNLQSQVTNKNDHTNTDIFVEEPISDTYNYPNPFSQYTTIEYTLPKDNPISIAVYDAAGKQIALLYDNELKTAGTHQFRFEANDYAEGIYYYIIKAGDFIKTQKMILVK